MNPWILKPNKMTNLGKTHFLSPPQQIYSWRGDMIIEGKIQLNTILWLALRLGEKQTSDLSLELFQ